MTLQASCCCDRCSDECYIVPQPGTTKCTTCEGGNQASIAGFVMSWDPQQYLTVETRTGCYQTVTQPFTYNCASVLQGTNVPWLQPNPTGDGAKYRQVRLRAQLYYWWQLWDAGFYNPLFGQVFGEAAYQYPVVSFNQPTVTFERFYQTTPAPARCNHRVKNYTGGDAGFGEFQATYTHCTDSTNWPDAMRKWIRDEVCKYSVITYTRNVYYQKGTADFGGPYCPPNNWVQPGVSTFARTLLGQTTAWYYRKLPTPGTANVPNYCFNRGAYQLGYTTFAYDNVADPNSFPHQIDPFDPTPPTPIVDPSPGTLTGNPGQVDRFDVVWPLVLTLT